MIDLGVLSRGRGQEVEDGLTTSFTLIRRGSVWISSLSYESFLDGDKG